MPSTPLPVVERALEINFGDMLAETTLPPEELQIERERHHSHQARLLTEVMLSRGLASLLVWAGADAPHRLNEFRPVRSHGESVFWLARGIAAFWLARGIAAEFSENPHSAPSSELRTRFKDLARQWHEQTDHLSAPIDIVTNFNYQQIIGMGAPVLPLFFDELRANGGHWYWALRAITGADPVTPGERGKVAKMKQSWLNWWKENA